MAKQPIRIATLIMKFLGTYGKGNPEVFAKVLKEKPTYFHKDGPWTFILFDLVVMCFQTRHTLAKRMNAPGWNYIEFYLDYEMNKELGLPVPETNEPFVPSPREAQIGRELELNGLCTSEPENKPVRRDVFVSLQQSFTHPYPGVSQSDKKALPKPTHPGPTTLQ